MSYEKLSSPHPGEFPDEWYDISGADHFWLIWRMRALQRLLSDRSLPAGEPLRVLDLGCGQGTLRSQLEARTAWKVDGADINEAALIKAAPGRGRTLLYDVSERLPDLREAYDGVVLFDVLEHVEKPEQLLAAACEHLKPGGWVLINVPALRSLYSRYDVVVGHIRRYNKASLRQLLQLPFLDPSRTEIRYWGFSLLPVAWLRKLVLNFTPPEKVVARGFQPPARWINSLLCGLMRLETAVLSRPVSGTSVMAIAYKRGPQTPS